MLRRSNGLQTEAQAMSMGIAPASAMCGAVVQSRSIDRSFRPGTVLGASRLQTLA